tara:strand:+ start:11852 stop:13525 length:1674 start_codon:yes stop_codon:yes gene_type:complete
MEKKWIILSLSIIGIISIFLKLYFVDFSTYVVSDTTSYALNAFSYINNDFTPIQNKSPGWPILISVFFQLFNFENFLEYGNVVRVLSISIATVTIIPVYLLSRRWFSPKYSLIAASFFAFEPHLNFHAGLGYSEPLYIIFWVIAFYFITSEKYKFVCLAFVLAGIIWWVRWPGAIMFLILSIIYFINFRNIEQKYVKYLGCVGIFIAIVFPMLFQRYEEFGNPLHFGITSQFFIGDYSLLQSNIINKSNEVYTIFDAIQDNGFIGFFNKFVFTGFVNLITVFIKNSFPFLIILFPIGMILTIRGWYRDRKNINANWILILTTLVSMIVTFSLVPEKRFLYHLIPFLILFSIIPIHRIIENGFDSISFSKRQKNVCIVIVISLVLLSSVIFMQRYETTDNLEFEEKTKFAEYILENFDGSMIDAGNTASGIRYLKLDNPEGAFKTYENRNHNNPKQTMLKEGYLVPFANNDNLTLVGINARTLNDFIDVAERYGIEYISIREKGVADKLYPYLNGVYDNELDYIYFEKVFDSKVMNFEKFKVKVFKINFEKFHYKSND